MSALANRFAALRAARRGGTLDGCAGPRVRTDDVDAHLPPGTRLGDRYEVEAPLGEGGMAIVYRGFDHFLGRTVAVKVMRESSRRGIVERFEREAGATAALRHPSVVRVYDYGATPRGYPYIVLEFVEGENVEDMLQRRVRLEPREAVELMRSVAGALAEAHAVDIVHRDIKPDNLVIQQAEGMPPILRVIDFSIAAMDYSEGPRLTAVGEVFGTPEYMAPEQALGTSTGPSIDVWACGVVLYRMLTGREPFDGISAAQIMARVTESELPPLPVAIPHGLRALVADCLHKAPEHRPRDGADLLRRLDVWLDTQPLAPAEGVLDLVLPAPTDRGRTLGLGAGIGAAFVGLLWLLAAWLEVGGGTGRADDVDAGVSLPTLLEVAERVLANGEPRAALGVLEAAPGAGEPAERALLEGLAQLGDGQVSVGAESLGRAFAARSELVDDQRVVPALVSALEHDHAQDAVRLLANPRLFPRARAAVLELAARGGPDARWRAVAVFDSSADEDRPARFAAFIADLDEAACETRRRAVIGLANLGDSKALPAMRQARRRSPRENRCMRGALDRAIRKLERND